MHTDSRIREETYNISHYGETLMASCW